MVRLCCEAGNCGAAERNILEPLRVGQTELSYPSGGGMHRSEHSGSRGKEAPKITDPMEGGNW